jgi:hypothetical protein
MRFVTSLCRTVFHVSLAVIQGSAVPFVHFDHSQPRWMRSKCRFTWHGASPNCLIILCLVINRYLCQVRRITMYSSWPCAQVSDTDPAVSEYSRWTLLIGRTYERKSNLHAAGFTYFILYPKYTNCVNCMHKISVNPKLQKGCVGNCPITLSCVRLLQSADSYHLYLRSVLILSPI